MALIKIVYSQNPPSKKQFLFSILIPRFVDQSGTHLHCLYRLKLLISIHHIKVIESCRPIRFFTFTITAFCRKKRLQLGLQWSQRTSLLLLFYFTLVELDGKSVFLSFFFRNRLNNLQIKNLTPEGFEANGKKPCIPFP